MKRIFDLIFAVLLLVFLSLPLVLIGLIIKLTSSGPVLYWSDRIGKNNKIFKMCKFRTMRMDAPAVATHLFNDADRYLTPIGSFLRKFSLDELPQLFNIVSGDMTFVGPRPALFNQDDLIELRTRKNVHTLIPGVTGWAQINGRDELPIPVKVEFDEYYLKNRSLLLDAKIILITVFKVVNREGVAH
ncbi:MAG: lipid carrier--UDP-N-acetylgalactosaminyltransferase [Candidatus Omnitrophica bacterium CG1_02_40_15]|nr:MAG: lipid carrier--UDP-N-acetylgalactosaminyltransferase [Candidatus Omnitrophica bacterium CG1_02_40_15]